jgi:hypothetical protein
MAYSDFTLDSVCRIFSLAMNDQMKLFREIPPIPVSARLRAHLEEGVPLGLAINTEKARSEFIVAPILAHIRRLMKQRISLFSGVEFDVDSSKGLNGTCDFILATSPLQLILRSPVLMVVEAKRDDIRGGMGQCIAEMVAARLLNEREKQGPSTIYGLVTTGSIWSFLKLEAGTVYFDSSEYYVDQLDVIQSILIHCVGGDPTKVGAAA